MKKAHGLQRALPPLAREQLESMPTGALLARLKRLRWCEDSPEISDLSEDERATAAHLILFKSDPAWQRAYVDRKQVLAGREHVAAKP